MVVTTAPPCSALLAESALMWAGECATIVHPTRGRMRFRAYPYQCAILRDRSPRRLIVKARQIGISQVIALEALHQAIYQPNSTILFVSRNGDMAVNLLGYCYAALAGELPELPGLTKENQSEIALANGSRIASLPANRSTGRGFAATSVYLDEYAHCDYAPEIYRSVSPTVAHGGRLTVVSTPNGQANHFYQLCSGIEGGDWSRYMLPWRECPAYGPAWYERERPKYTAQSWASEYECDFQASGQAVFRAEDIAACADGWLGLQAPLPGRRYVTAWDIGRRQDATVGITLDATGETLQVVAFDRFLGVPYPAIQQEIERRASEYPGRTIVESNGPGDPVIENLACAAEAFVTTARSKVQAITALALAHEQRRLKHDIPQLRLETQLYQWNDQNLVQDCVMAAAIAVQAVSVSPGDAPSARSIASRWTGADPDPEEDEEAGWSGRWK